MNLNKKRDAKTYAISNLSGSDVTAGVMKTIEQQPRGAKSIIVEFPCIGTPRIAYATQNQKILDVSKNQTIDKFIMDFDQKRNGNLQEYIVQVDGLDYLLINPNALSENPITYRVSSNQTLINLPLYLKTELQRHYDFIYFVTQGTLSHPTTYFSIRVADAVILHSNTDMDLVGNVMNYKRLNDTFGVSKDRMFLFSADPHIVFDSEVVYKKYSQLMKAVVNVPPLDLELIPYARLSVSVEQLDRSEQRNEDQKSVERVGIIDPLHYLHHQFHVSDIDQAISEAEGKNLEKITHNVRRVLQEGYLDDYVESLRDAGAQQRVREVISDLVRDMYDKNLQFTMSVEQVILWVQTEITQLGVIQEIMEDPTISSIEINGPDQVIVEQNGVDQHRDDLKFQSLDHYNQLINKLCEPMGKSLTGNEPILDLNYKGFRVCVVADRKRAGVSAKYPLVSIRKFAPNVYSNEECVKYGNTSWEIIEFQKVISHFANIMYAGGTNSGKTSSLLRQPLFVPSITRIVSIEDSEELMYASKVEYQHYPNLPSLLVKDIVGDAEHSYGIGRLVKATLRLRPEVIVIGEIRDEGAAREGLIAMNTGHRFWSSIHSNSARDTAIRFLQLCGNDESTRHQVANSIDFIFYQRRLRNGKRVIVEVAELIRFEGSENPVMNPIFKYDFAQKKHVRVGSIVSEKVIEKMAAYDIPAETIEFWCNPLGSRVATA